MFGIVPDNGIRSLNHFLSDYGVRNFSEKANTSIEVYTYYPNPSPIASLVISQVWVIFPGFSVAQKFKYE